MAVKYLNINLIMKVIIFVLLLTSICTFQIPITPEKISEIGRDFITGFFKAFTGQDYSLKPECFGDEFKDNFNRLLSAINKENALLALAIASDMKDEAAEHCKDEFVQAGKIFEDIKKIDPNKLIEILTSHSVDLIRILKELLNQTSLEASTIGAEFAKIIKVVVYSQSHNQKFLTFLEIPQLGFSESSETASDFVEGLFEGVSSVPYEQNKCKVDVKNFEPELVAAFEKFLEAIRTGKGISDEIKALITLFTELQGLDSNCHFKTLIADIASLGTDFGIIKMLTRVGLHITTFVQDVTSLFKNFIAGYLHQSGLAFGKLVQLTLNFSTQ
jgi:hypothetical protein